MMRIRWINGLACFVLLLSAAAPARGQASMFADPKARQVGDLITVVLAERTSAQRESRWENAAGGRLGGGGEGSTGSPLAGRFGLDADFNKEALSRNESVQSDLLNGTITARVVDVDGAGNLVVEGERRLEVNGETHLMRINGTIRPYDVRSNNTVLSHDIANASIVYRRAGLTQRVFRVGRLLQVGVAALLGAAIYSFVR